MKVQSNKSTDFYTIAVSGLVQGVGFRPFIYRLAYDFKLKGYVENRNDGVFIKLNCKHSDAELFKNEIIKQAPIASNIYSTEIRESEPEHFDSFFIKKSENISNTVTEVSPDIAVCDECLADLKNQEHRVDYPFINCTNCGPRFTIIQELPYDRPKTTMAEFKMCPVCETEYTTILDRRFHAQPIACNHCGPVYTLRNSKNEQIQNLQIILNELSIGLEQGKIYAVKGLGGFHLMCDALNDAAVNRLRALKKRDGKPFAVMFDSMDSVKDYTYLNSIEEQNINSWRRPIVLLKRKKELAYAVCNGLSHVGAMLPYMPFHYLLFEQLKTPVIVLTSGNISSEPIILSNQEAILNLGELVDGVVSYNRDIYNRTDDSVVTINNDQLRIIRRSRGFTPAPIRTHLNMEGIFASGAELVNSFGIGKGDQAILSQYIGDLKNFETFEFYKETYHRFESLFRFKPELIVRDLHPDYLSSQFADSLADLNAIPIMKVQHHHAHIASVMIDHGLDRKVIGISMDGIGLGDDGKIWGAEFFVCDFIDYNRKFHFEYTAMPGGDKATKEPWRMAISYLHQAFGDELFKLDLPLFKEIPIKDIETIVQLINKELNAPLASSAGRLFDAVAAILGVNIIASFHAEAPMRLEAIIDHSIVGHYPFEFHDSVISFRKTIQKIALDKINGIPNEQISSKFHQTIVKAILCGIEKIKKEKGLNEIVFSGGTFQNKYLIENLENQLIEKGYQVYLPVNIPFNDQGIAMGQLAIAAKRRELI